MTSCLKFLVWALVGIITACILAITLDSPSQEKIEMAGIQNHNQKVLDSLTKGDLVEFRKKKGTWSQCAVYIGDKKVIHLVGKEDKRNNSQNLFTISGKRFKNAAVTQEKFWDLAKNLKAFKNNENNLGIQNNGNCHKHFASSLPDDPEDIANLATAMIGPVYYNDLWSSDALFAMFCRYKILKQEKVGYRRMMRQLPEERLDGQSSLMREDLHAKREIGTRTVGGSDKANLFYEEHNEKVLKELSTGDLIEFFRPFLFSHWAVYIGDRELIHYTSYEKICENATETKPNILATVFGKSCSKAVVSAGEFWKVADNCKANKNNKDDAVRTPKSPEEIVATAKGLIGKIDYNILWNNCEHFALYCRYGTSRSDQVIYLLTICIFGAVVIALIFLICFKAKNRRRERSGTSE